MRSLAYQFPSTPSLATGTRGPLRMTWPVHGKAIFGKLGPFGAQVLGGEAAQCTVLEHRRFRRMRINMYRC